MSSIELDTPRLATSGPFVAGFSTRLGGVSPDPYASLNTGLSTSDAPANVARNRKLLLAALGLDPEHLAIAGQIHGAVVRVVDAAGLIEGVDGLVAKTPGLVLGITAADCAVVLLADATACVVGACHAGWRGTVAGIVENTVEAMKSLGASAPSMQAYISPCISVENFEVGEEVARQFDAGLVVRKKEWERPHVDLKRDLQDRLRRAGISAANIEVSPACTVRSLDRYFSYRGESGETGRMMGFIGISQDVRP